MRIKAGLAALSLKVKIIIACTVIAAAGIVTAVIVMTSSKEDTYRVLKVFELSGSAVITREGAGELDAYVGMNLESGDTVSVDEGSTLRISMDGDKYVLLDGGTVLELVAEGTPSDSRTSLSLKQGTILNELTVSLSANSSYEVATPKATMAVRGTSFMVSVEMDEDGSYIIKTNTFHGTVEAILLDADGNPTGKTAMVPADKCVIIRTEPNAETGNPAEVDGRSFFVYEISPGVYVEVPEGDDPVSDIIYELISEVVKKYAIRSNDDGTMVLDGVVLRKLIGEYSEASDNTYDVPAESSETTTAASETEPVTTSASERESITSTTASPTVTSAPAREAEPVVTTVPIREDEPAVTTVPTSETSSQTMVTTVPKSDDDELEVTTVPTYDTEESTTTTVPETVTERETTTTTAPTSETNSNTTATTVPTYYTGTSSPNYTVTTFTSVLTDLTTSETTVTTTETETETEASSAVERFTITYELNDTGYVIYTQENVLSGDKPDLSLLPTVIDTDGDGTYDYYLLDRAQAMTPITGDTTVHVKYVPYDDVREVKIASADNSEQEHYLALVNGTITLPTTAGGLHVGDETQVADYNGELVDCVFIGWGAVTSGGYADSSVKERTTDITDYSYDYLISDYAAYAPGSTVTLTTGNAMYDAPNNYKFVAIYARLYTVTFVNEDGNTLNTVKVRYGTTLAEAFANADISPPDSYGESYTAVMKEVDGTTQVTGDCTITVVYQQS